MGKNTRVKHAFKGSWKQHRLTAFDGLYPDVTERGLIHRDRSGQKLRDVVDPRSGFCTGVSSPMHNSGEASVRPADGTSGGGEALPTRDPDTGLWWVGNDRLVVRTTQTPDGPLRTTRIVKAEDLDEAGATPDERKAAVKAARAASRKPDSPRREANRGNRPSDREIREYLKNFTGYTGPITRQIRQAAIAVIVKQRTVAAYQADLDKGKRKR